MRPPQTIEEELQIISQALEAGIDPFVKKKLDFVGKDPSYVPTRMSSVFKIQTGTGYEWSVPSDSPIRMGNAETGEGSSPIDIGTDNLSRRKSIPRGNVGPGAAANQPNRR